MRSLHARSLVLGLLAVQAVAAADTRAQECGRDCLLDLSDRYMEAVLARDWSGLPWAAQVRFTENDVALMIGDGVWGTATRVWPDPFKLADPGTGNVLWLGVIEEHGQASYYGMRLGITDGRIAEVETVVSREGTPAHFAPPAQYRVHRSYAEPLRPAARRPRERMIALVEGWYNTMQLNDGVLLGELADDCARVSNGVDTTHGPDAPVRGCRAQFEIGLHRPVDRVRARRYPIVDEERGIVVALAYLDHAARYVEYPTLDGETRRIPVEYPNTHRVLEMFKLRDGAIERVEGIAVFQLYLMPALWMR